MKNFKYFLFGSAIALVFISIIEKFMELIMLWIEVLKIRPSKKLLNYQKDVMILKEFLKPTPYVDLEDFEEDYEDEDD